MLSTLILLAALADPVPAAAPPSSGKKICRSDFVVGSRLGGKPTCRTKAEWDRIAAHARHEHDRVVRSRSPTPDGDGRNVVQRF